MKIFIGGLSFATTDDTLRAYFKTYGTITDAVVMKDSLSRRSRGFGFITFANPSSVDDVLSQSEHIIDNRRVEAKRAVPRSDTGKAPDPASGIIRSSVLSTMNGGGDEAYTTSSDSVLPGSPNEVIGVGGPAIDNSGDALTMGHQQHQTSATGLSCAKLFVGGLHYDTRDSHFRSYFEKYGKVVSAEVMFNRETRKSRGFGFVVFESVESASAVLQSTHHTIGSKLVEVKPAIPRMPSASGMVLAASPPPIVDPLKTLSPDISGHHSLSFPNTTLGKPVNMGVVSSFGSGTYATAAANGLTHLQRGATGGNQQVQAQQLQPGQEAQAPLFPPQQPSSSLFDKGGNVSRPSTDWRDIVNGPFVRSQGGAVCNGEEPQEEDIPPTSFLQQVLNVQHQSSSTSTASVSSFSPYQLSMDPVHGHARGSNHSPFLMGNGTQPPQPLCSSHHVQQWQNTSSERTAEGMIEAAMADLNLGFGLQDGWDEGGSDCTYPGLDLNAISPSAQTDRQGPLPSLDIQPFS